MRIVAGSLRGKTIDAPDGLGTRPTTDRVREALFSSLYSLLGGFEDEVVLDAFAGSGALGLEAISRGAAHCTFYERDAKAAKLLKRNIERCGVGERATVVQRDVMQAPPTGAQRPFDIVFLDPPYAYDPKGVLDLVTAIGDAGALGPGAIIVYEHGIESRDVIAGILEEIGLSLHAVKKYGKTAVTIAMCQDS